MTMLTIAALLVGIGLAAVVIAVAQLRAAAPAGAGAGGGGGVRGGARGGGRSVSASADAGFLRRASEPLSGFAADLVGHLSPRSRTALLRHRIVLAGREGSLSLGTVMAQKAAGALIGAIVVGLIGTRFTDRPAMLVLWVLGGGIAGYFLPDVRLGSAADKRQKEVARELGEAIDLLAITVEAGLGLEQALDVVAAEVTGPLGDELRRVIREIGLGVSRREALVALRARTDVTELSAFVVALVQAEALGMAISDVLKVQASQVRMARRQRAREQAAKMPVKILFPVIFGVLPALFVVVIGPGALTIMHSLVGHGSG